MTKQPTCLKELKWMFPDAEMVYRKDVQELVMRYILKQLDIAKKYEDEEEYTGYAPIYREITMLMKMFNITDEMLEAYKKKRGDE
jgi:hypothetical protein